MKLLNSRSDELQQKIKYLENESAKYMNDMGIYADRYETIR